MQRIKKGREPKSLRELRSANPEADWDTEYQDKQIARALLGKEQGHLCCFCLGRITPSPAGMKIAHFVPQSTAPTRELPLPKLTWSNLFGACKGNEGRPLREAHCDTRQGSRVLDRRLHPCDYQGGTLRFDKRGRVVALDAALQREIEDKLGLNLPVLVEARQQALRQVLQGFPREGAWSPAELRKIISDLETPNAQGRLPPYYICVQDVLRKKLEQAQGQKKAPSSKRRGGPMKAG